MKLSSRLIQAPRIDWEIKCFNAAINRLINRVQAKVLLETSMLESSALNQAA